MATKQGPSSRKRAAKKASGEPRVLGPGDRAGDVADDLGWVRACDVTDRTQPYRRYLLTQAQLAAILRIGARQIQNLEEKGLPHEGFRATKNYPWPDAMHWYRSYLRRLSQRQGQERGVAWLDARVSRAEHELEEAEYAAKNAKKERTMYGRELTPEEAIELCERDQYLRGRRYFDALVAGRPLRAIRDDFDDAADDGEE